MSLSGSSNKLRNVGSSQLSCRLRSQSESAVSKNKNTHGRTPNNQSTPSKTSTSMTPTTPGRNNIEFDQDLKLNLIYDLIFWKKNFFPKCPKRCSCWHSIFFMQTTMNY